MGYSTWREHRIACSWSYLLDEELLVVTYLMIGKMMRCRMLRSGTSEECKVRFCDICAKPVYI